MILHTNYQGRAGRVNTDIVYHALSAARIAGNVSDHVHIADGCELRGSRTHVGAISFSLEFIGEKVVGDGRRWRNSGKYGGGSDNGLSATWDEHGHVMAQIFELDATARFGSAKYPIYDGREDFHRATGDAYRVTPFVSLVKAPRIEYVQAWECTGPTFSGYVYAQAIALDKLAQGCDIISVTFVRYPDGRREVIKGAVARMVQAEREL